ncbi:MAG TPA: fibronectin type III domain-containing protein [Candidatus Nitrosotalea sp.]|nr:fibronectin type III domain-containing protein [Candidatus Nitrosotalea sp.]
MVWNYGLSLLVVTIVLFTLSASYPANAQLSGVVSTVTGTIDNTTSIITNQITGTDTSLPTVNQTVGSIVNTTATTDITTTSGSVSIGNPLGLPLPTITIPVSASSSVAGVTAFGNGTITSSVNGVQMSFWFDPQGPTAGQNSTTATNKVHIVVNAQDLSGNQIPGMFIELQNSKGSDVERGDTPVTFTATSGQKYIVYANNYKNVIFNHWDDGTTNPARHVTPTQSSSMTAFYSTGTTTGVSPPPTGLMTTTVSSSQINLRWNAPTDNGGSQITGYTIERSLDNGATWSVLVANTNSPGTTYSDTGLGPNTTYTYRISAMNSSGSSLPSTPASATTAPSGQTITTVQSGLVAADSLTNETKTQQQLAAEHGYWFYGGDAPAEHAPLSFSRDASGLHIGVQAPANGTYAGFYATSPVHNAKLWHAKITNPVRTTKNDFYENGLYVQTANGNVSYVTCTTLTNNQATVWAVVNATGNTTQITAFDVLYFDPSANQPLTRDCTIITNGDNFLQVFFDGAQVYENQHGNLQMPAPFNAFLEPQTSDGSEFLTGSYQDYYVALDKNVSVTNLPSNAGTVNIVDNTGNVLATSSVSGGNATLDVGKFHLPLAAKIQVLDSNNNMVSSSPENIYGGDAYSVTISNPSPQQPGIVLNNVQSTSGITSSNKITLSNFNSGSDADRLLVVGISANSNNVASVTFGGIPLTMTVSSFSNNDAEFWYLKNPSGIGNIVVTTNGPTHAVVGAYSFSGVDQTVPIVTHVARHNTSPNSPSISITTASPNDWVLDLPSMYGGSTLGSPTCTQGWNVNMPNQITGASSSLLVPTPGTVACGWTANVGDMWDDVAVEIDAAR